MARQPKAAAKVEEKEQPKAAAKVEDGLLAMVKAGHSVRVHPNNVDSFKSAGYEAAE